MFSNNSLSFWDYPEFDFELNFNLSEVGARQKTVFYSDIISKYCTLEESFKIRVWDIETNSLADTHIIKPITKQKITCMSRTALANFSWSALVPNQISILYECEELSLWLILTSKNVLLAYDIENKRLMMEKHLNLKSIVKFIYSVKHKALIAVCRNTNLSIFELKYVASSYEMKFITNMAGHITFIVDADYFENIDILASIDDNCIVKLWNLENLTCCRTIELEGKAAVKGMFFLKDHYQISIITRKINVYRIEHNIQENEEKEINHIIDLYYCENEKLFYIFKSTELVFINAKDGTVRAIYKYNKKNEDTKNYIVANKVVVFNEGKRFYLADTNGNITIYTIKLADKVSLLSHKLPVNQIYRDQKHNLTITISSDTMCVQDLKEKDKCDKYVAIKKVENIFDGCRVIKFLEINLELNLFMIGFGDNKVYVFDYEFGKLYACIELDHTENIEDLKTFGSKGFVIIITSSYQIIVLNYTCDLNASGLKCNFEVISTQRLPIKATNDRIISCYFDDKKYLLTKDCVDILLCISLDSGAMIIFQMNDIIDRFEDKQPYYSKISYNVKRTHTCNFNSEVSNIRTYRLHLTDESEDIDEMYKENYYLIKNRLATKPLFTILSNIAAWDRPYQIKQLLNYHKPLILSTDNRFCFKVQNLEGNNIILYDIREPLPLIWNLDTVKNPPSNEECYTAIQLISHLNKKIMAKSSCLSQVIRLDSIAKNANKDKKSKETNEYKLKRTSKSTFTMRDLVKRTYQNNLTADRYIDGKIRGLGLQKIYNLQESKKEQDVLDYAIDPYKKGKTSRRNHQVHFEQMNQSKKTTEKRTLNDEETNKAKQIAELFNIKTHTKALEGLVI